MKNERYYYSVMTQDERKAYKMIYSGLKMRAFNIVVSLFLSSEQVQEVYLRVLYDNPMFYFINQTIIRMTGKPGYYVLLPEYIYSNTDIDALNKDIINVVNKVDVKARIMRNNEFRLEKYLHDSVVKSVAYDYESLSKSDCYNAHSIVGAFIDKKAVCEGIAKAFKLLCNAYSIKCIVVLGKASQSLDFSGDCYHAWNLVKIGNESYYVDVTWDNMYEKGLQHISYDYFNMTTEEILKDHHPIGNYPYCSSINLNYFYCTKSIVSTYNELLNLLLQRINSHQIMFMVSTKNNEFYTKQEIENKTILALNYALLKKGRIGKKYIFMINEIHGIGKIIFEEENKGDKGMA